MAGGKHTYTVFIRPEDHLVYGAEAIGRIIKRDAREIPDLVASGILPAWKGGPNGKWRALCTDLIDFNLREKERNQKPCQ